MSDKLTTEQVAQELGYHIRHVQRILRQGVMKGEKFGRTWVIPRSEVERIKSLQGEGGRLPKEKKSIEQ